MASCFPFTSSRSLRFAPPHISARRTSFHLPQQVYRLVLTYPGMQSRLESRLPGCYRDLRNNTSLSPLHFTIDGLRGGGPSPQTMSANPGNLSITSDRKNDLSDCHVFGESPLVSVFRFIFQAFFRFNARYYPSSVLRRNLDPSLDRHRGNGRSRPLLSSFD